MTLRSGLAAQLGVAAETTVGTYVAPSRFFEFTQESLKATYARVESKGLRSGQRVLRKDHVAAGRQTAAGDVELEVGNKGFGLLFQHMLGAVASTTPGTLTHKHSCTLGDPTGLGLTVQVGRPDVSGTVQPFSYVGCKVDQWELSNDVDGILMLKLTLDAIAEDITQTLAAASAPTLGELFVWTGGVVQVGGVNFDLKHIAIQGHTGLKTDRYYIKSGGATKKEQLPNAFVDIGGTLTADFDGLTAYQRVTSLDMTAGITATWTGSLIETGQNYKVVVTLPAVRFDSENPTVNGPDTLEEQLTFKVVDDGTNAPITVDYYTTDATP